MKKKNKIKFLEEQDKYFDSDCPTKSILAKRVDEIGLGYEQVKVEPEVLLPDTNYLGVSDKFAAYKNETDGSEYIASPSLSANKEEVSAFYLGGTFVANTCETMLTVDPREVLEEPESVEETVSELELSVRVEEQETSCIIPINEVKGWGDTNVEEWDKPVDENGEEIVGEWVVMNGGVVYNAETKKAELIIKFIPVKKEDYREIIIDLDVTLIEGQSSLLNGLVSFFKLDGNGLDEIDGESLTWENQNVSFAQGKVGQSVGANTGSGVSNAGGLSKKLILDNFESFSIAYWINVSVRSTWNNYCPLKIVSSDGQPGVGVGIGRTTDTQFSIFDGLFSPRLDTYINDVTNTSEWCHIVQVYNNNSLIFYVNGVNKLVLDGQYGNDTRSSSMICIHSTNSKPDQYGWGGAGWTDEAGFWNRALSSEEVEALYQAGCDGVSYPFEGILLE